MKQGLVQFLKDKYIFGTNDGFIYPQGQDPIQRVPEIAVDTQVFLDRYFGDNNSKRELYDKYKEALEDTARNIDWLRENIGEKLNEFKSIQRLEDEITWQRSKLSEYFLPYQLGIRGFITHQAGNEAKLYDGSMLGISDTLSGELICDVDPEILLQVNPYRAGFVPRWRSNKIDEYGIIQSEDIDCGRYCVKDLLDISNINETIFKNLYIRDDSSPPKIVTAGGIYACVHGGGHRIDMFSEANANPTSKVLYHQAELDSVIIRNRQIFLVGPSGIYTPSSGNFAFETPHRHKITSVSPQSNLCTLLVGQNTTKICNFETGREVDEFEGFYRFLPQTLQ